MVSKHSVILILLVLRIGFPQFGAAQPYPAIEPLKKLAERAVRFSHLRQANLAATLAIKTEAEYNSTGYLPRIATHGSFSYFKFLLPNKQKLLGDSKSDIYTDISLVVPIYDWGRISARNEIVDHEVSYREDFGRQVEFMLVRDVTDAYCEYLAATSEAALHQIGLERLRDHLSIARRRYEIGRTPETDVLRIRFQIEAADKDVQAARERVGRAYSTLQHLCFLDSTDSVVSPLQNDARLSVTPLLAVLQDSLARTIAARHPLLRMASSEYAMEQQQQELATLENRPEMNFFGIASWEDGSIPFGANFNYNIGIEVRYTLPFLGGSGYQSRIEQSEYRLAQKTEEQKQLMLELRMAIDRSLSVLGGLVTQQAITDSMRVLAARSVEVAREMYNAGQVPITDLLDAQASLTQTSITREALSIAFLKEYATLMYYAGNGHWLFNMEQQR